MSTRAQQSVALSDCLSDRYQDLAGSLTEIAATLAEGESVADALDSILRLALRTIPGCHCASATVFDADGRPSTMAATDDSIRELERRQYELADGPGLDAARRLTVNRWSQDEIEQRWPEFSMLAKEAGLRSYLSAGLGFTGAGEPRPAGNAVADRGARSGEPGHGAAGLSLGAINLACRDDDGFSQLDEELLTLVSGPASATVVLISRYYQARELVDQLSNGLSSRSEIDQAIGILMAESRCDADTAFTTLARASNNRNVKLRDLAAEIVARFSGPGAAPGGRRPARGEGGPARPRPR